MRAAPDFSRFSVAVLFIICGMHAHGARPLSPPENCRQVVLVVPPIWTAPTASLRRFARTAANAPWQPVGKTAPVLIGERGLGWGLGLHQVPADSAPRKMEGDRRAPAGIFQLTAAFGRAARKDLPGLKLPYQPITDTLEAVDDPASRFYNRLVDRARIAEPDWHSSEKMSTVPDYALGVVVAHNPENRPGAGSCIFLHLWLGERRGTAGCTVLRKPDLVELICWLDPAAEPVLIQLPAEVARDGLDRAFSNR